MWEREMSSRHNCSLLTEGVPVLKITSHHTSSCHTRYHSSVDDSSLHCSLTAPRKPAKTNTSLLHLSICTDRPGKFVNIFRSCRKRGGILFPRLHSHKNSFSRDDSPRYLPIIMCQKPSPKRRSVAQAFRLFCQKFVVKLFFFPSSHPEVSLFYFFSLLKLCQLHRNVKASLLSPTHSKCCCKAFSHTLATSEKLILIFQLHTRAHLQLLSSIISPSKSPCHLRSACWAVMVPCFYS